MAQSFVDRPSAGNSICDGAHAEFVNQIGWFPEHNCAVHVRWQFILEHIPEMRELKLYNDLSGIYRNAIDTLPAGNRLFACYDMAILQYRFWQCLFENNLTMTHVYGWNLNAAQAWQRRIQPRLETQLPWRRNKFGKVKKPTLSPVNPVLGHLH